MITATHGASSYHAAGLAGHTSGAATATPAATTATPAPTPHVPAPPGNARRLQLLTSATATADAAAAAAAPGADGPAEPPHVGPRTTVLDTLRWNSRSNLAGNQHCIMVGQAVGDPRLGGAVVDAPIRIGMHEDPRTVDARAAEAGVKAALRILDNTERDLDLHGTPAGQVIESWRHYLSHPGVTLTAQMFSDAMRAVSETMHADFTRAMDPSTTPRTAGRMPTECVTELAHRARAAMPAATPAQQQFLTQLGNDAMARTLRHDLSVDGTKAWLKEMETGCRAVGLDDLADRAAKLDEQMPAGATAATHGTRMHDNMYGRALESAFIAKLVDNPPPGVLQSMDAMATHLDGILGGLPPADQEKVAWNVLGMMRPEPRSWEHASPKLMALAHAATPADSVAALRNVLQQPAANGADCLAIPYLTVKMSLYLQGVGGAPWMEKANENYFTVIGAASARDANQAVNFNRWTPKAGITAHHQPDIVSQHVPAMHPSDRHTPKLHARSPELTLALEQGVPFVSGVSGSTNIALHMVGDMVKEGKTIDAKDALLGTMMFLTHDGGHSMHEAMWVGNQLDARLGLDMHMPGGEPRDFVADYQAFFGSFPPEKSGTELNTAMTGAWQQTLDHFGQHSHFRTHSE